MRNRSSQRGDAKGMRQIELTASALIEIKVAAVSKQVRAGSGLTRHGRAGEGLGALLAAKDGALEAGHAGASHGGGDDVGHDAAVLELIVAVLALGALEESEGGRCGMMRCKHAVSVFLSSNADSAEACRI
jgi:hypothetical protein